MEMENKNLDKTLNTDIAFERLYSKHSKLDLKIKALNKIKYPTAHEDVEKKLIQKKKLFLKDKMELFLTQKR